MSNRAYFATDGSFGDAEDLEIIDVSTWTEADWNEVQDESDECRLSVARFIAERYENRARGGSAYVVSDLIVQDKKEGK